MKKKYFTEEEKRLAVNRWNRAYAKRNREKALAWGRDSYHRRKSDPKNLISFMLRHARARAAKKGLEFTLTEADIHVPEYCPVMGVKLDKNNKRYGYSLDRIDSSKGYTPDNVWVIPWIANAMKWDSTKEERLLFAKWILSGEGGGGLDNQL